MKSQTLQLMNFVTQIFPSFSNQIQIYFFIVPYIFNFFLLIISGF